MPTITLYGGAGTIGGNKILLEDGDSRLFFDFGTTFATRDLYFEEYLKPPTGAGLLDPLEMNLLPPLEGPYLKPQRESFPQRPFCFADAAAISPEAQEFWTRSPNHVPGEDNRRRKGLEPAPFATAPDRAGGLPGRFFPVDHSVRGAGARAVETSAGWVVYR